MIFNEKNLINIYLMLTGLFHRAIIQSGSSMNPWAYENNPKNITFRLAKHLGYKDDLEDSDKLIDFLRKVPPMTLINKQYEVLTEKVLSKVVVGQNNI